MDWRKWNKGKRARSERASKAARARWEKEHSGKQPEPRETRHIEITIRDSHRPMTIIRAHQEQQDYGRWSRLRIEGSTSRPVSRNGMAKRIAAALL